MGCCPGSLAYLFAQRASWATSPRHTRTKERGTTKLPQTTHASIKHYLKRAWRLLNPLPNLPPQPPPQMHLQIRAGPVRSQPPGHVQHLPPGVHRLAGPGPPPGPGNLAAEVPCRTTARCGERQGGTGEARHHHGGPDSGRRAGGGGAEGLPEGCPGERGEVCGTVRDLRDTLFTPYPPPAAALRPAQWWWATMCTSISASCSASCSGGWVCK
jgi:hypothetical protein